MTQSPILPNTVATPAISVVMCTRDRPSKIGNAVASVLANDHGAFNLTVVDQSTSDATRKILMALAGEDPRFAYVHLERPGLSRAYNAGIARSTAPIIAFTDDDCIAPPDWLRWIDRAFRQDPAGDLLYGQVIEKPEYGRIGSVTPELKLAKPERLSKKDGFRVTGMGANFAARRRLFDAIGGFDEVLGGGGPLRSSQDFDLEYRTYRAGCVILLRPEVIVLHDGRRDPEDWPGVLRNYGIGDGAFYSKHVRCGDLYALRLLAQRVCSHGSRIAVKKALGQKPVQDYLVGIFVGIRDGFKFTIDRSERCYRAPEATR